VKAFEVVQKILEDKSIDAQKDIGQAFAPSNIALCKYWGKRNTELNLPVTSSLSISLGDYGANIKITINQESKDSIFHNGKEQASDSPLTKKVSQYLELFRNQTNDYYTVELNINIPMAAGLASSACCFAALAKALNDLYQWNLELKHLSILARLGSGSAARSLWNGFVEWEAGQKDDGMDCYAKPIETQWLELRIGLLILSTEVKKISSREAMQQTVKTSELYKSWPKKVETDLIKLKQAIKEKDFQTLGQVAESNAIEMHKTMLDTKPEIQYSNEQTFAMIDKILTLRESGLNVYFTQDAGPNLKLLFLEGIREKVAEKFPELKIISPF